MYVEGKDHDDDAVTSALRVFVRVTRVRVVKRSCVVVIAASDLLTFGNT
jgi:hypothetical protein